MFRTWADIEPRAGQSVPGVLWTITAACETSLDLYEDVAGGLYRRFTVSVRRDDTPDAILALTYRMNRSGYEPPEADYLSLIAQGYTDFGLDERGLAEAEQQSRV